MRVLAGNYLSEITCEELNLLLEGRIMKSSTRLLQQWEGLWLSSLRNVVIL